jgi:hypothetical protein
MRLVFFGLVSLVAWALVIMTAPADPPAMAEAALPPITCQ